MLWTYTPFRDRAIPEFEYDALDRLISIPVSPPPVVCARPSVRDHPHVAGSGVVNAKRDWKPVRERASDERWPRTTAAEGQRPALADRERIARDGCRLSTRRRTTWCRRTRRLPTTRFRPAAVRTGEVVGEARSGARTCGAALARAACSSTAAAVRRARRGVDAPSPSRARACPSTGRYRRRRSRPFRTWCRNRRSSRSS